MIIVFNNKIKIIIFKINVLFNNVVSIIVINVLILNDCMEWFYKIILGIVVNKYKIKLRIGNICVIKVIINNEIIVKIVVLGCIFENIYVIFIFFDYNFYFNFFVKI